LTSNVYICKLGSRDNDVLSIPDLIRPEFPRRLCKGGGTSRPSGGEQAMGDSARTAWKIAVTGSAGVGKTSLVEMLAAALDLPRIEEEMRAYLERTRAHLWELPSTAVAAVILDLWRERAAKETNTEAFVADNCALDFVAYALHYGCFTEEVAAILLPEVL